MHKSRKFFYFVFRSFRAFVVDFFIATSVTMDGFYSSRSHQAAKKQNPGADLQTGNREGQDKSNFSPWNDAAWSVPVPDDHKKNDRRRNEREPHKYHRNQRDIESNLVITDAVIFQILYLALGFAGFQTNRAKMAMVELNITQRAQKSTAGRTGDGRLFARVIKTAGFFLRLQRVSGSAGRQFTKYGRVNIRACQLLARRAGNQRKGIDCLSAERCLALGARKQKWSPS